MSKNKIRNPKINYPFFWIDAFTSTKFHGNPCAVMLCEDFFTPETMQTIACEINLSETAFVKKSRTEGHDFEARYFTPKEEIPMAGHPTIASIQALREACWLNASTKDLKTSEISIILKLKSGLIPIGIKKINDKNFIFMEQLPSEFLNIYPSSDFFSFFNLQNTDLLKDVPIQTVSTGTPMLMVPLKNLESLKKISVDFEKYKRFQGQSDFFSIHFFCLDSISGKGLTFARHFGIPPDTAEDAFTGSATGCMAAYLKHYGLFDGESFQAEQGHWLGRPGTALVRVHKEKQGSYKVQIGGQAVTLIQGTFEL